MPILENQRHELFAQEIAKGKSASEAYKIAGYRPSRKNAGRLKTKEDINARVSELQGVAARSTEITIKFICRELDEANAVAKERGQASAMVSASALRAKLAGLMVERVEVGGPGDFEGCSTLAGFADRMIEDLVIAFRPVDEKDREGLIALLGRHMKELGEFISAIRARPITAVRCNPAATANWRELELHPSEQRQITNSNGSR